MQVVVQELLAMCLYEQAVASRSGGATGGRRSIACARTAAATTVSAADNTETPPCLHFLLHLQPLWLVNMRCLVLVLLVAARATLAAAAGVPCALAGEFLQRYNVTADDKDVPGAVI
uniref:Uncharacterized protein n=1 Tax=Heliothis virescens TaxID=7102 RepID=A0A2A4K5B0_HELVI